jgi:hypothetical protein
VATWVPIAELTNVERQDYEQKKQQQLEEQQKQQQQQQLEEQQRGETKLPVEIESQTTTTSGERHMPEPSASDQIMEDPPSTSIASSEAIDVASTQAEAFKGTPTESSESQQGDVDVVAISSEEPPLKRVRLNDPVPQATSASAPDNDTAVPTEQLTADEDVSTAIKRTRFDEEEPSPIVGEPTSKKVRIEEPPTEREPFPTADAPVTTLSASTITSIPSQQLDDSPNDEGVTILEQPASELQQEESNVTDSLKPEA